MNSTDRTPPSRSTHGQRSRQAQPARRIALDVIMAVRESDAYANLLLPTRIQRAALTEADAGLATELTYGTLRMQGYYDAVIELAAGRTVEKIDPAILDVLRLACHQLLSMRVAKHAAVDESVLLARTVGSQSATGFVNGVLRTITRAEPDAWLDRVLEAAKSSDDELAREFSHPIWVVRSLKQSLASEGIGDELAELLAADNVAPQVSLVALPGKADATELGGGSAHFSPLAATLDKGDPTRIDAVRDGRARVQDEGSQLAALALSRARPIVPGELWLDLCAGPGGKAALLAAEAELGGATLVANELVPARAQLVRNALAPFEPQPEVWEIDGTTIGDEHPSMFDRILLDAPCTGLGALRRRPEARWRKQPRDIAQLAPLQRDLLDAALVSLKPGGILAYVTCSPHLGETRAIIGDAVKRHGDDIELVDTPGVLSTFAVSPLGLPDVPHAQLWPHRHGTDAMFIQLIAKRAS